MQLATVMVEAGQEQMGGRDLVPGPLLEDLGATTSAATTTIDLCTFQASILPIQQRQCQQLDLMLLTELSFVVDYMHKLKLTLNML